MSHATGGGSQARAWTLVALLWLAFLLNYVDRQAAFSIFPALERDLGFTSVALGLVGTVFIWTYAAGILIAGRLADKLPRPALVLASLVLWSLSILGSARSGSVAEFLFWRGAMGLTEALYFPAATALIASLHGSATRSRALSIHQSAQLAGSAVGGSFGGWTADHAGWRAGFASLAWLGIAYAAVLAPALGRLLSGVSVRPAGTGTSQPGQVLRSRPLQLLAAAFFFFCGVLWMIYAWLPHHLYARHSLTMTQAGFIAAVCLQASNLAGILAGGYLGDKFNRLGVTCAGLLLSPPFAWAVFAAPSLPLAAGAAAAFGLTAGLFQANVFSLAFDWVAEGNRGFTTGLLNAAGGAAGGAGILLAGYYRESLGVPLTIATAAAATFLAGLALARFARPVKRVPGVYTH